MNDGGMEKCSACQKSPPVDAFAGNTSRPDGLQANCRECAAEYYRRRREAQGKSVRVKVPVPQGHKRCPQCEEVKPHAEWERISYFQRKYGLSPVELEALIAEQHGICCICLAAPAEHVDHCHETGRVRGVLCFSCNAALGQFKDQPDAIRRAAAYVEGNAWKPTLVAPGVCRLPS